MRYFIVMTLKRLILLALWTLGGSTLLAPTALLSATAPELIVRAERAIANEDDAAAERWLGKIPTGSLSPNELARTQIVRARVALQRRDPGAALRALPPTSHHVPALSTTMELLRAEASFMAGDPVSAVRTLSDREYALTSAKQLAENRELIWSELIKSPIAPNKFPDLDREAPMSRGWLDLAQVMQNGPSKAAIEAWRRRNPGHPADSRAESIQADAQFATRGPAPGSSFSGGAHRPGISRGYALLIPTSGHLSAVGSALRDGFISGWFEQREPRPPIRIYDTGSNPAQAIQAFRQALSDGADFIIGPVMRESVSAIGRSMHSNVPWMALNYLDGAPPGIMQFGLAPEDEAYAAARDAIARDQRSALILAPANDWGNRAVDAFTQVFTVEGGTILGVERYALNVRDLSRPLSNLLNIRGSEQRHRELTQILGRRSEFEPQPRSDAQVLFAPLRAREAHTLLPKLDFFRSAGMTTYMLSAAHGGAIGPQLNGVHLCDMPWVTDMSGRWSGLRTQAYRDFPDTMRSQPRLFALGSDAIRLATALRGRQLDGRALEAASGQLSLVGGRVQRGIACMQVQAGP